MGIMGILIVSWTLIGIIIWTYCVYSEGELIVEDIPMLPIMALVGPLIALFVIYKTIWRKSISLSAKTGTKEGK